MSRRFGQPDHRPAVSAEFSAEILDGGSASRPAEIFGRRPPPSLTAVSFR